MSDEPRRATEHIAMVIHRVLQEDVRGADFDYYAQSDWDDLPDNMQEAYKRAGQEAVKWFADWMGLTNGRERSDGGV